MSLITKSTYLRGPKGDIGLQGPKGDRGLPGAQGPQGIRGPDADPAYIRFQISGSGNITYNNDTGVIGFTNPGYATTTYVDTTIANLIGGAPAILDTLKEIADAINNDPNFYSNKLSISGGTLTGSLILNADPVNNLEAATKQYVDNATSSIATSLAELTDVDVTTTPPTNGQVLSWNSTESIWKPNTISGSGGNSGGNPINISISTYDFDATAGQTVFSGADINGVLLLMSPGNYIQVYKNGSLLRIDNNWTYNIGVPGGDNITLTSPASLGDWIHIEVKDITNISEDLIIDGGAFITAGSVVDGGTY